MTEPPARAPAHDQAVAAGTLLSRRRVLWAFAGGALAVTLAGLGAAQVVRSPAQQVADAGPPPATVLTATVEERVLADTVVLRGTVSADTTVNVTPAPAESGRTIVTGVRAEPGEEFDAGAVLVEVSGRPVIALAGEVPAYRDLRPGMRGTDVTQLQESLSALGYTTGDADGEFGVQTKSAITALYRDLGYNTPTTGDENALAGAEEAERQAERALSRAEDTLERLTDDPPPPPGPGEPDPVEEAKQQVRYAQEDLTSARESRAELARTTGAMLPMGEVVFLPDFPSRVEQSSAQVGREAAGGEQNDPLLTVSSGELVVRSQLNLSQRELLSEDMPVEIYSELDGIRAGGAVTEIGDRAADPDTGDRGHTLTVAPTGGPLDEQLAGSDVRLTVEAATTDGEVLVVPVSAVFQGGDGTTTVLRVGPDGTEQRLPVTPGVSGDGYVAVAPVEPDILRPGDEVAVGERGQS